MSDPRVAVVIPTRGRETRLAFALEALAKQVVPPESFEVIVVRDADARGPLAPIPAGVRVRYLTCDGVSGPTAKRNRGWRATTAPLVAFTDDDCRPYPGWLAELVEAATDRDAVLQGRTEPDPDERHLLSGLARSQEITGPSDWYEACNVAYPRVLLERLGGFDEAYTFGGEDTDLGLRAIAAGAEHVYLPNALVWHAVHYRPVLRALRDAARWPSLPLILARHPEQRRTLYRGVFWNEAHAALTLGVAILFAARSRGTRVAGFTPYLALHLNRGITGRQAVRPRPLVRLLVHVLFARLPVDLVSLISAIRGAIRHRVLVI